MLRFIEILETLFYLESLRFLPESTFFLDLLDQLKAEAAIDQASNKMMIKRK
jgi:hypothetical protein